MYITKDFKNFTVPLHNKLPMVTVFYSKMVALLKDTLNKFIVDKNYLPPSKSLKPIHKLQKLD